MQRNATTPPGQFHSQALVAALRAVLVAGTKQTLDRVFVAEALSLPSVSELLSQSGQTDPVALHRAREAAMAALAADLQPELRAAWEAAEAEGSGKGYAFDHAGVQLRALRNIALAFLARLVREGKRNILIPHHHRRRR